MSERMRVAVAGASGIGRHHAKWHARAGSEVVAFLGSSEESCRRSSRVLSSLFPFFGRGYWDLDELLAEVQPQIVDVCVPNDRHCEVATTALAAGCDVLCEKPLVWNAGQTGRELLDTAAGMIRLARAQGCLLGVCTQYAAAVPQYSQLHELVRGALPSIETFYAEMETLSRGRQRSAAEIWVDMGPHPLSLLLAWLPESSMDSESLRTMFEGPEATARFTFVGPQGSCACEITVRDRIAGVPVRRFGINGAIVDCGGRADANGDYESVLRLDGRSLSGTDFLSSLISQFDQACLHRRPVLVPGDVGLRNMEMLVQIAQHAGMLG